MGVLAFSVVPSATATVVTNSARTSPLIARNAPLGSSASRRAAISPLGLLVRRARARAPAIVSHGPAVVSPMISRAPPLVNALACPEIVAGGPCTTKKPSSAIPAASGITRHQRGGLGVTRRAAPSGEIRTRRSASRAAATARAGTPITTIKMSGTVRDRSLG
jgi:hypothetical protein